MSELMENAKRAKEQIETWSKEKQELANRIVNYNASRNALEARTEEFRE